MNQETNLKRQKAFEKLRQLTGNFIEEVEDMLKEGTLENEALLKEQILKFKEIYGAKPSAPSQAKKSS